MFVVLICTASRCVSEKQNYFTQEVSMELPPYMFFCCPWSFWIKTDHPRSRKLPMLSSTHRQPCFLATAIDGFPNCRRKPWRAFSRVEGPVQLYRVLVVAVKTLYRISPKAQTSQARQCLGNGGGNEYETTVFALTSSSAPGASHSSGARAKTGWMNLEEICC